MVVWRLTTHHKDSERLLAWSKAEERIAVGWNGLGDRGDYGSEEEIRRAVKETGNQNWPFSGRLATDRDAGRRRLRAHGTAGRR